jgi:hypothetical protein
MKKSRPYEGAVRSGSGCVQRVSRRPVIIGEIGRQVGGIRRCLTMGAVTFAVITKARRVELGSLRHWLTRWGAPPRLSRSS